MTQNSLQMTQSSLQMTQNSLQMTQSSLQMTQSSLQMTQNSLQMTQSSLQMTQRGRTSNKPKKSKATSSFFPEVTVCQNGNGGHKNVSLCKPRRKKKKETKRENNNKCIRSIKQLFVYFRKTGRENEWNTFTVNPLYTDTRCTDKIRYKDNLTGTKPPLKR